MGGSNLTKSMYVKAFFPLNQVAEPLATQIKVLPVIITPRISNETH